MKLIFGKSKWEMWEAPLKDYVARVARDGFSATEIYLDELPNSVAECRELHAEFGLPLIGQIATSGATPDDHLGSLEKNYLRALEFGPIKLDAHAGRDIFSLADNARIYRLGCELASSHGVPLCFETHRYRGLFCLPITVRYLEEVPAMRITADFSHFTVVHESMLDDQMESLEALLPAIGHVHARVGYAEGPQVSHPGAPEWADWTQLFTGWWKRMAEEARRRGDADFTITPEFGPVTYMPTIPFENRPVADAWETNVWMLEMLKKELL